ncbi:hypothetical protein PTKIN_Ptkin16aG0491400 [Pterospermum kingtungense]
MSILSHPSSIVDQEVMGAARAGDVEMLYRLIRKDRNVLERISMKKFEDTPLHIAAAEGKTDFSMEMMYLQPSFATKLNADGLSPLHLALQNKHTGLALSLLKIDESLVSVKGKLGYTPFHYLVMKETASDDLTKFLKNYPDCIHDVTSQDETPLHVAARNITNSGTLEVMLHWLRRTSNFSMEQKQSILNSKSRNGDTVLHIAVSNEEPDPEIVRILRDLRIDIKAKNSEDKTALNILEGRTQERKINVSECEDILRHAQGLPAITRKTAWYFLQMLSQWGYEIKHMSNDRGNALLVVTVLILTATYQATLSPPGGVFQANAAANDSKISGLQIYFGSKNTSRLVEKIEFKANKTAGSSVLDTQPFLWFFIPNVVAFSTSFIITCL